MLNASTSTSVTWAPAESRLPTLGVDPLTMLTLRFVAHLPYFKVASMLMLPQGLSNAGVVVTTLVFALACLVASRWSAGLRRSAAELPHTAVLPLLGTTAVIATMMAVGPAIAMLLPRHPELAADAFTTIPVYFGLIAPVCAGFFAAQLITAPRRIVR